MTESDDVTIEDDEILPDNLWVICFCDIILELKNISLISVFLILLPSLPLSSATDSV